MNRRGFLWSSLVLIFGCVEPPRVIAPTWGAPGVWGDGRLWTEVRTDAWVQALAAQQGMG